MKILHVNTNDRGGAATACIRIHLGLLNRGIDSKILFLHRRKSELAQSGQFQTTGSLIQRFFRKVRQALTLDQKKIMRRFSEVEWFTMPVSPYDLTSHPLYKEADIIQLNWVSGFLDEPSFFRKNTKPVVWRMADLYNCGGGYHYEKGFPFQKLKKILLKNEMLRKRSLRGHNITFVPISNWVKNKADESDIIREFPKKVIHNGLDFSIWMPQDKTAARERFDLPKDQILILMGADINRIERKGMGNAVAAIEGLQRNDVTAVVFGNYTKQLPQNFMNVGKIKDEATLVQLYSAADYFLMSSLEEAFGQVTIEALSCGVPVISYPNGGSLDVIRPSFNGMLADDFSVEALTEALKLAMDGTFSSEEIIKDVQQRFNIQVRVEDYIALYKKLHQP